MAYREIDINLTDENRALRDMVRKFGAEVMRPAGLALDKLADPEDVIAEGSVLWDVVRKYHELGLHKAGIPRALGGSLEDMDAMSRVLISEEYPIEKMFRDARASMIEDGVNESLSLSAFEYL